MFLLLDEYYKSNHSCFLLQYHLVLVTKYHHLRLTDGVNWTRYDAASAIDNYTRER